MRRIVIVALVAGVLMVLAAGIIVMDLAASQASVLAPGPGPSDETLISIT